MLEAIVMIAVLTADQIAKYFTDRYLMPLGTSYPLWEGVFHLTSAHNTGAAFGMLAGAKTFFIVVTVIACAILLWVLIFKRHMLHRLIRFALALVLAGAVGNLIDRIWLGYVRDMLDFCLIHFAIFNVADAAVCIGMGLLLVDVIFFPKGRRLLEQVLKTEKKPQQEDDRPQKQAGMQALEGEEAQSGQMKGQGSLEDGSGRTDG